MEETKSEAESPEPLRRLRGHARRLQRIELSVTQRSGHVRLQVDRAG